MYKNPKNAAKVRKNDGMRAEKGEKMQIFSTKTKKHPNRLAVWAYCFNFANESQKLYKIMEAKTTKVTTRRRLSKTWRTAVANKWMIELVDPELQAQCKSYKDGKKIINL